MSTITINGIDYDMDLLIRAAYEARAHRRTPFTDEEWASLSSKASAQGSLRRIRADILQQIKDGEFE